MFESVTPRPGKIAFRVDPFPVATFRDERDEEEAPVPALKVEAWDSGTLAEAVSEAMVDDGAEESQFAYEERADRPVWSPVAGTSKKVVSKQKLLGSFFSQ